MWRFRAVGGFDIVIGGAFPISVPRGFGDVEVAPFAKLEGRVVWVNAGVGPCRADDGALQGGGEMPLVLAAEGLVHGAGDLEGGRALL